MIVVLERNAFINFFKSGFVKIAMERRINFSLDKLIKLDADTHYNLLDPIIPEFEEEQEIIFIEFKKNTINSVVLQFEDILKIFNSTEQADFLNAGKFNTILNIDQPYFSSVFERIKLNRNYKAKQVVNELLKRVFSVSGDSRFEDFIYKSLYTDKQSNFIKSLIAYNVTPGILPQGNLEFILKVGLAIFDWKGTSVDKFEKGDYYKNLITNVNSFKNRSLSADLEVFYSLLKNNYELEKAYNIIVSLLSEFDSSFDLYKVAYFYLGFKFMILKADNDISNDLVLYNLAELKIKDPEIFVQVIHLLSRTFSFNELYEGGYKLLDITVLKKQESCVGMLKSFYAKINDEINTKDKEQQVVISVSSVASENNDYRTGFYDLIKEGGLIKERSNLSIDRGREVRREEEKSKDKPNLGIWKAKELGGAENLAKSKFDSNIEEPSEIRRKGDFFEEKPAFTGDLLGGESIADEVQTGFDLVKKKGDSKEEVAESTAKTKESGTTDGLLKEKNDSKQKVLEITNIENDQVDIIKFESKKKEVKSSSRGTANENKKQQASNQGALEFSEVKGKPVKGQGRKRTK